MDREIELIKKEYEGKMKKKKSKDKKDKEADEKDKKKEEADSESKNAEKEKDDKVCPDVAAMDGLVLNWDRIDQSYFGQTAINNC